MSEILINKLKRILFEDNKNICVGIGNRIFVTDVAFDLIINAISDVPLYNEKSIWPSLKDCVDYQKQFPLFNVIIMYLWLQETNKHPDDDKKEVLEYIDSFLLKHFVVLNKGERMSDYIKNEEKTTLPKVNIKKTNYDWLVEYISKNLPDKLNKKFPSKNECIEYIETGCDCSDASDIEASLRIVCYFLCLVEAKDRFININNEAISFVSDYLSDNLETTDDKSESYSTHMFKQTIIEFVKELNTYVVKDTKKPYDSNDTITVYFTNNKYWNAVNVYWVRKNKTNNCWPGSKMQFVKTNNLGEDILSFDIPSDIELIVFSSENGFLQTVDITNNISNGIGFYLTDNYSGKYEVNTYMFNEEE